MAVAGWFVDAQFALIEREWFKRVEQENRIYSRPMGEKRNFTSNSQYDERTESQRPQRAQRIYWDGK